jgi:predicted anti-sigma-YlaC factor YlaD
MRIEIGCQFVTRELSAYLDRELPFEQRLMVEEHLRECRRCVAVYDGVRNLLLLVTGNEEVVPLPEGFRERIYCLLKKHSNNRR